jgi:hypothetical protein
MENILNTVRVHSFDPLTSSALMVSLDALVQIW